MGRLLTTLMPLSTDPLGPHFKIFYESIISIADMHISSVYSSISAHPLNTPIHPATRLRKRTDQQHQTPCTPSSEHPEGNHSTNKFSLLLHVLEMKLHGTYSYTSGLCHCVCEIHSCCTVGSFLLLNTIPVVKVPQFAYPFYGLGVVSGFFGLFE